MTRRLQRSCGTSLGTALLLALAGVACGAQPGADAENDTGGRASGGTHSGGGPGDGDAGGASGGTGGGASGGGASGGAGTGGSTGGPGSPCRKDADCGSAGPYRCCGPGDECWGFYCGISPSQCGMPILNCDTDADCPPNGTCVSGYTETCPQCQRRDCVYPPPLCNDGYDCLSSLACEVGSARADEHGCVAPSCADSITCPENERCTAPSALDDGCRPLECTQDADCDSGPCSLGACGPVTAGCVAAPWL